MMSTYETIKLMIAFAMLVLVIVSGQKKVITLRQG